MNNWKHFEKIAMLESLGTFSDEVQSYVMRRYDLIEDDTDHLTDEELLVHIKVKAIRMSSNLILGFGCGYDLQDDDIHSEEFNLKLVEGLSIWAGPYVGVYEKIDSSIPAYILYKNLNDELPIIIIYE